MPIPHPIPHVLLTAARLPVSDWCCYSNQGKRFPSCCFLLSVAMLFGVAERLFSPSAVLLTQLWASCSEPALLRFTPDLIIQQFSDSVMLI